jgi:hypothetical protein
MTYANPTADELVSLDRDFFLNDEAVKLAVKTYMIATDSYRDPLGPLPKTDSAGIREAQHNMTLILRAYHLDGLVTTHQILHNLRLQELRNSDDPAIRKYYEVKL